MLVPAPCGKCPECLKRNRMDWYIRNKIELQNSSNAFFITLTYNDENLPISDCNGKPKFSKIDIQLWLKRFRKSLGSVGMKYFLASEYGGQFGRPHYHALLYNIPHEKVTQLSNILAQTWNKGFVSASPISDRRISYVCKYMLQKTQRKKDYSDAEQCPFYLASRRPAIGSSYINDDNILYHLGNKTTQFNLFGLKTSLPQYYKRKIFDGYEDIKEEIRNDYLNKVHSDYLVNRSIHDDFSTYCKTQRYRAKVALQKFKKYSKDKFQTEVNQWITDNINNLK